MDWPWRTKVHGVTKSQTWLNNWAQIAILRRRKFGWGDVSGEGWNYIREELRKLLGRWEKALSYSSGGYTGVMAWLPATPCTSVLCRILCPFWVGFPGSSDGKASACSARDPSLIPGSGRSAGEGAGYPLQYSCRENPMDGGAWRATINEVSKSQTWLSD